MTGVYLMKLLLIILLFMNNYLFSQQILFRVGDNISDYLNTNPPQYLTQGTNLLNFPDGRVDFLKYKMETTNIDTKFLVQGTNVFGVMQFENNTTVFLLDITGDGILDVYFDSLILPFTVLTKSQYTRITRSNNLLQFLDYGLNMYNSDPGPYAPDVNNRYISGFSSNLDISIDNRDLFYGMLQYYNFVPAPQLALMIITSIGILYEERFGTTHPVILLHIAESLINLGFRENAVEYINSILSTNPDFIPAKVYSWQLEENQELRQRKYNELKTNHPNHWIVRQI